MVLPKDVENIIFSKMRLSFKKKQLKFLWRSNEERRFEKFNIDRIY